MKGLGRRAEGRLQEQPVFGVAGVSGMQLLESGFPKHSNSPSEGKGSSAEPNRCSTWVFSLGTKGLTHPDNAHLTRT